MIYCYAEYFRRCDVCYESEAADWRTREEAEQAAIRDGWVKLTYKRWMCPKCEERAELNNERTNGK